MKRLRRVVISVLILGIIIFNPSLTAQAKYSVNYKSPDIEITEVNKEQISNLGKVSFKGVSTLDKVWFCLRGPQKELVTYPVEVQKGKFSLEVWLRFGPGNYTVWAGDNPVRFDGRIRFELESDFPVDARYLFPSAYVDSNNPEIIRLTQTLLKPSLTDEEKAKTIYNWITGNIKYDYDVYINNTNLLLPASETLKKGKGICRDYAFLTAALGRAAGLQARVVYGQAGKDGAWDPGQHAWNEFFINGEWISLDPTWGAGYIGKSGKFVASPSDIYFNPEPDFLAKTHRLSTITLQ